MSIGDNTANSIIWVPGESTGTDENGASTSAPTADSDTTYTDAAVDALHDRLVASGVLPN